MTPDFDAHSFDSRRERAVPPTLQGRWLNGEEVTIEFERLTLVVAVKVRCDGCRDFVNSALEEFGDLFVVVVSATNDPEGEWRDAVRPVLVAPHFLTAMEIRWPPFYALVEPSTRRVLVEGVVFGAAQVAQEIAPFLG